MEGKKVKSGGDKMRAVKTIFLFFLFLFCYSSVSLAEKEGQVVEPSISAQEAILQFEEKESIVRQELVVKFKDGTSKEKRESVLRMFGLNEVAFMDVGQFSLVKATKGTDVKALAQSLLNHPSIEFVEPNHVLSADTAPKDPGYARQWHLPKINALKAWQTTKGNSNIIVAVVDNGIETTHSEFAGKIISPYDVLTNRGSVPRGEHGTHVAGIIAAALNNKGVVGVAPNVKIMPVNVFSGESATSYYVALGIIYATNQGANIINLSLGGYSSSYYLETAVEYAASKGVILVAAAGNDDTRQRTYPAALEPVIAVSATNKQDYITQFSNYGDYIDISAPGENIYSTFPGNSYRSLSGTSMAAPVVSGTAALILSKNPLLTREEVRNILARSTVDLGDKGWDVFYGYGRIDVYKALANTPSPCTNISSVSTFTTKGNNSVNFSLSTYRNGLQVSIYVKDARGTIVRGIMENKRWGSKNISFSWDGKRDNGAFVRDGKYTVVVKISNGKNKLYRSKQITVVDHVAPAVQLPSAPVSFSPKVKGNVSVPLYINKDAKVTAQVYDSKNKLVKTIWNNRSLSGGSRAVVWDGKHANGKLMTDGKYMLKVSAVDDKKRKSSVRMQAINIDTRVVFGSISLGEQVFKADGNAKASLSINVKEELTISVDVKTNEGVTVKKLVNKKKHNSGSYIVYWDGKDERNNLVKEGKYYYALELVDKCGNKAVVNTGTFTLEDWRKPVIQGQANLYYTQLGNFQIPYTISKDGRVTVAIYQGNILVRTIVSDVAQNAGNQGVVWDGKDGKGNNVSDGKYNVQIKLVDARGQSTSFTSVLHVDLTRIDAPKVVWFYEEGSTVFFRLGLPATVNVQIFNDRGERVRTIWTNYSLREGKQSFLWDGLDDQGNYIFDPDAFFIFRITAQFTNGVTKTTTGEINNEKDPAWLVSHSYLFIEDDYSYYYNALQLFIHVKEQVKLNLHVYDAYDDTYIDKKTYSLNPGIENKLTYEKKVKYDEYVYLLEYEDQFGNLYYYKIDETAVGYYHFRERTEGIFLPQAIFDYKK